MLVLVMAALAFFGPASHLAGRTRTGHASLRRIRVRRWSNEGSSSQNEFGGNSIPAFGGAAAAKEMGLWCFGRCVYSVDFAAGVERI